MDGTIHVGSIEIFFYAINNNGTLKWKFDHGSWVGAPPAIGTDGTIYFVTTTYWWQNNGTGINNLYALYPDGTLMWQYSTGAPNYVCPVIRNDGTVYIAAAYKYLYALNNDGTLKWNWIYNSNDQINAPAIEANGTLYLGSSWNQYTNTYYLYSLNPDGTMKWKYRTGKSSSMPAIDIDGTIYTGSDNFIFAIVTPEIDEVLSFFGQTNISRGDLDGDGDIDGIDLVIFAENFEFN